MSISTGEEVDVLNRVDERVELIGNEESDKLRNQYLAMWMDILKMYLDTRVARCDDS